MMQNFTGFEATAMAGLAAWCISQWITDISAYGSDFTQIKKNCIAGFMRIINDKPGNEM